MTAIQNARMTRLPMLAAILAALVVQACTQLGSRPVTGEVDLFRVVEATEATEAPATAPAAPAWTTTGSTRRYSAVQDAGAEMAGGDESDVDEAEVVLPGSAEESSNDSPWEFGVAPYIWAVSMKGDAQVQGFPAEIDLDFGDILDRLSFAYQFTLEARKGLSFVRLDQDYMAVYDRQKFSFPLPGPGNNTVNANVKIESDTYVATLIAGTAISEEEDAPRVFVGTRYWDLEMTLKARSGGATIVRQTGSQNWFDALVGAEKKWTINDRWGIVALGDYGGFGIGEASDKTWQAYLLASRQSDAGNNLIFGWRHVDVDNSRSDFKYDVYFTGPIVGYVFRF